MKYSSRNVLALALALMSFGAAKAQTETPDGGAAQTPVITYTANHPSYVLGGLVVDEMKGYDADYLQNISGLVVGQSYEIPGPDISEAIRKYWAQKVFSNVEIVADSIVDGKAYLHVKLTAQPRISSINYTGVKKSEREDCEKIIGFQLGNQITTDMVNRAEHYIKKHFEEKGFKNCAVNIVQRDDVTGDNRVIVDINIDKNQKTRVKHIYITGVDDKAQIIKLKKAMKKTSERSIRPFKLFRSHKFLPEKYAEDKDLLIEKMNSWGYRDAMIVSDSIETVDEKHVNVHLNLYEGKKYYLRNVSWVGNTVYNSDLLERILQMQKGDVYNQTLLNKRLTSDDDAIGNLYYNNGYVFYNLNPVEVNIDGDSIDLEMRISEGQQATFNHVRISGNDRVYENVIRRELRTKPGDLFSMESIKRSIQDLAQMNQFDPEALQSQFGQSGIKPDPVTGTVDLNYPLTTKGGDQIELSAGWGQTGIIGRVGLKFTNFSVQNLFRKGIKRGGFIPQGDGQTLSLQVSTNGTYYQSYSLSFLEPWLGGKRPNQLSFGISYSKQSDVNSNYINQNYYNNYLNYAYGYGTSSNYYTDAYDPDKYVKLLTLNLGFGKRLRWPDDYFTFMAELGYTRYMLKSWQYFLLTDGNCNKIDLTLSLQRNSTDHPFFPRKGSEFLLQLALTPPYSLWDGRNYKTLGTDYQSANYQNELQEKYRWIEYHKWKLKFRNFTALSSAVKAPVLMTRCEFGILGAYNRHKKSPFETYYVGGDGMSGYSTSYLTETIGLRGYENGSLSGNNSYYGDAYAYCRMTLELRYPLMLETSTSIYALAFIEGGNAWSDVKKFNPFNMKRSAGVGVRILLPMVGLMGIDWAYGFQKQISGYSGKRAGGSQFHFIIGQEF